MDFPLAIRSDHDADNIAANSERLINLYAEPKAGQFALKAVPGMTALTNAGLAAVRSLGSFDGALYAIGGGSFYTYDSSYTPTLQASVVDDPNTTMSSNDGSVTIVLNGTYSLWNGTAISNPTAGAFSSFGSVSFVKGYSTFTEKDGARWCWSDVADATTLPALNFATAESVDDNLIRGMGFAGNQWLFGEESIEIWAPTGLSGANAFTLVNGAVIETGLKAFGLVTKLPNGLFLIGSDGIAYVSTGLQLQPVSVDAVHTAIDEGDPSDCFYYEIEGHKFCVLRFRDRPSWVYDIVTGLWHERAEAENDAWSALETVKHAGSWLVGTNDGFIHTMTGLADAGNPLICTCISPTLTNDGQKFKIPMFQIYGKMGFKASADVMFQPSRDFGVTWGQERLIATGALGKYAKKMTAKKLGQFDQATFKVAWDATADFTLNSKARIRAA